MTITFHPYRPDFKSDPCSICKDPLDRNAIAHGIQNFHQMCKKCAKAWLLINPICPVCKIPVNSSSLFSRKERVFIWLKNTGSALKNSCDPINALPAFLGSIFVLPTTIPSMLLAVRAVTIGSLAGITASVLARIEKPQAAFLAALFVTTFITGDKSFSDIVKEIWD